jgi:hypothetical protein
VKWLLDHDAPLYEIVNRLILPWTGFVADAFILSYAEEICPQSKFAYSGNEELVRELEERMLLDNSVDSCCCRCSPGGCTPFVVRMKKMALSNYNGNEQELSDIATTITKYFKEYGNTLQRKHCYAAIRSVTFHALGIAHTCVCGRGFHRRSRLDAEEIEEIQDEYAELLEILESLTGDFEARVCELFDPAANGVDNMTTFWSGHWVHRMSQVLSGLSEADEASKSAAEDLGVIWSRDKPESDESERAICAEPRWEGWDYYFERIEAIE